MRTSFRTILLAAALAAASLVAVPLAAQVVAGTVRSAGRPVIGADVRVLELDRLERSGPDGTFRFASVPAGTYTVVAAAAGYALATDTVRVGAEGASVTFDLHPSPLPLAAIVVTATPTPRPTDQLYQPVASKDRSALDESAGMTFAEKISDLPGVAVRGNGAAAARPILRGLGDNEVLVLENGLRTGDLATYDPAHATPIDAMGIDQVDVVRGPATVLYGPSSIGGLVNVLTSLVPAVADHPVSGTAAIEGNSVNSELAGYVNAVLTSGQTAFRVSGGGLHAGDTHIPAGSYTDPGSGTAFNLDRQPQTFDHDLQGGAGISHQGAFGMVGIGFNHFEINYGIPGVPPNPDWQTAPPTTSRIAQQRNTVQLRGLFNAGGSLVQRVKVDASYNDYGHSEFPTAQDSSGVSDPQANHFHKQELNAVLQVQQRPAGALTGAFGLWTDLMSLDISGDQPLGPNSVTTGLAAFAYEELRVRPGTSVQGGIRFDYNRIHANPDPQSTDSVFRTFSAARLTNAVTASLGVIHQMGSGLTGSLSIARSFRAPTVQELFANGLDAPSGTYTVGTASLGPETGIGVDASLKATAGRVAFEVSPFLNVIDHYIYGFLRGDTIQDFPVRQFGATSARLEGVEGSVSFAPAGQLLLQGSASYVNAQDTRLDVPLPFIPPLHGLVRATWQGRSAMAMAEVRLAAKQNRLGDGDTPTDGYAIFNLGAGVRFVNQGLRSELSVHCDNLFDQVYRDHTSVIKDFVPQPGRGFRVNYQLFY